MQETTVLSSNIKKMNIRLINLITNNPKKELD